MVATVNYPAVGRCIYCGSTDSLSDEHIVPFSLGGKLVLRKASCKKCQDITGAFEGHCASRLYASIRIRENLPTRRPKNRPTKLPVTWENKEILFLPVSNVFATLPIFYLLQPGYLRVPAVREVGWSDIQIQVA